MYGRQVRQRAIDLHAKGWAIAAIEHELGVSRSSVVTWVRDPAEALRDRIPETCFICTSTPCAQPGGYAYLLGQYLGDGYIAPGRVPRLRIACSNAYPAIAAEVDTAMQLVSGNRANSVRATGCSDRYCYWKHWPCVLPQHGPGRKHERPIVLADWQQRIVDAHPWPLIRGLIHSDGCRSVNRVVTRGTPYAYPRYFFSNESTDILAIMGGALDRAGVAWRFNRRNSISVARRADVARMDAHVGPKA